MFLSLWAFAQSSRPSCAAGEVVQYLNLQSFGLQAAAEGYDGRDQKTGDLDIFLQTCYSVTTTKGSSQQTILFCGIIVCVCGVNTRAGQGPASD